MNFIYGYYGNENFGDELFLSFFKNSNLKNCVFKSSKDYGDGNKYFIESKTSILDSKLKKLYFFIIDCIKFYKLSKNCKRFIIGGGSIINGSSSIMTLLKIYIYLICFRSKKKYAVGVGVSINKCSFLKKIIINSIYKKFDMILLRDENSYNYLKLQNNNNIILGTDLILENNTNNFKYKNVKNVGITVAPSYLDFEKKKSFISLVNNISKNYTLSFLIFQDLINKSDANFFEKNFKNIQGVELIYVKYDNYGMVYNSLDAIVGMRYHSLVLAYNLGIPFFGLYNDLKVKNLCDETGFSSWDLTGKLPSSINFFPNNKVKFLSKRIDTTKKFIDELSN